MLASRRAALLDALRSGMARSEAMRVAHISRDEFYAELKRSPEFRDEVRTAAERTRLPGDREPVLRSPDVRMTALILVALPGLLAVAFILLGIGVDDARLSW